MDEIILAIIDIIKKHMIAKAFFVQNHSIGDKIISVTNTFQFEPRDEIVILDNTYSSNQQLEYAKIKRIIDTRTIELYDPIQKDWGMDENAFIQKAIGHVPLYCNNVYYGDRDVIPTHELAITVNPDDKTNEWLFIDSGRGLDNKYNVSITIYGKSLDTENGLRILVKYADALCNLFNTNIHLDIDNVEAPLTESLYTGDSVVVIEDTARNREFFTISGTEEYENNCGKYAIQSNLGVEYYFDIIDINFSNGKMYVELDGAVENDYILSEFSHIRKHGRYLYDSRATNATYGVILKGSSILRAAKITWFGNEVAQCCNSRGLRCSSPSKGVDCFEEKG
jgi:hypothetical protein